MAANDILVPFLGAFQAAIAVLLTIGAGVFAAQMDWLNEASSRQISKLCVKMFLPCLLIYNVGSQIEGETALYYVPIIIWAIVYNLVSIGLGIAVKKAFKLPEWTTPAIAFNNTTSLPLLLVQSLSVTGILDAIDSSPSVVDKAKAFFLVNAMVGNSLTFALGPKLLNGQEEDAPDAMKDEGEEERQIEELGEEAVEANERTSLLPGSIVRPLTRAGWKSYGEGRKVWIQLPDWAQRVLDFLAQFLNAPLIGAAIGIVVGIVPELHRIFFNSQQSGGHLNPTITQTLSNLGSLFAVLQIIVVGVKLSVAAQKMKSPKRRSDDSQDTSLPWTPTLVILLTRFVLWPAISIPLIYLLATRTSWVLDDPLLWFCLMLMPTGPPALKLTALADVNGAGEEEKLGIAKLLIISYSVSPVIAFAVVGSLKAAQAAAAAAT